jgi:hypothetical protein
MIQITATITNPQQVIAKIKALLKKVAKAEDDAVRIEGFRLMRLLRKEIAQGAPGGRPFAPLSIIRRTQHATKRGGLRANRPLARLSRAVGYEVKKHSPAELTIGFVGRASSVTWRRLAKMHQEGFEKSVDAPYGRFGPGSVREVLAWYGSLFDPTRFKKSRSRRRNVFFLRKQTGSLKTPARPIIDPFWDAHRSQAMANIRENFRRKLSGERI